MCRTPQLHSIQSCITTPALPSPQTPSPQSNIPPHPPHPLKPQLQLPILALRIQRRNLDIDRNLTLQRPDILIPQSLHVAIGLRDPHHHGDPVPLVVGEAVLLHDALDEFLDGEVAQENGPVVDFGFGGADVDV